MPDEGKIPQFKKINDIKDGLWKLFNLIAIHGNVTEQRTEFTSKIMAK